MSRTVSHNTERMLNGADSQVKSKGRVLANSRLLAMSKSSTKVEQVIKYYEKCS